MDCSLLVISFFVILLRDLFVFVFSFTKLVSDRSEVSYI